MWHQGHRPAEGWNDEGERTVANGGLESACLSIKFLTGQELTWPFDSQASILDIKRWIQDKEGIPTESQRVVFAGQELQDDRTTTDYSLEINCTIHVVLRTAPTSNSTAEPHQEPAAVGSTSDGIQAQENVRSKQSMEREAWDIRAAVDWSDLLPEGGGCEILDTARRAIALDQLHQIVAHFSRRIDAGERWRVRRYWNGVCTEHEIITPDEVNLYDCDKFLIRPASIESRRALVELMSNDDQPPEYFVSHWWGEEVKQFVSCLTRHCIDRGLLSEKGWFDGQPKTPHPCYLGGRSPHYWVCAYANRQFDLASEIAVDDLQSTSFFRALLIARGTVSIIDPNGVVYNRIWCVYELYISLVGHTNSEYTFDMYTAVAEHEWRNNITDSWECSRAVGICTGLAAVDMGPNSKHKREAYFPLQLVERGIDFTCSLAKASIESDKERIVQSIGSDEQQRLLDCTVHGRLAAACLRRALEAGAEMTERFLRAIARGRLHILELSLEDSPADNVENMRRVVQALDCNILQQLQNRASESWKRAGEWLKAALRYRKFVRLTKLNLFSKCCCVVVWFVGRFVAA